ncbi:MAG: glycosyltransferase family 2 protein [Candidatus Coatesbacteria bacterium]|nr:glycosyltransferase family 2 protein [Candidatus Coatesbacteria bacterium]
MNKRYLGNIDLISILIPCYNEQGNILPLFEKIRNAKKKFPNPVELIYINDGSKDKTLFELLKLKPVKDISIKIISLGRNLGKANAYTLGFSQASGKVLITMDGDLQDDPFEIPSFIESINSGYDLVNGWKYKGKGSFTRAFPSRIFNKMVAWGLGLKLHDFNCPFKAYKRELYTKLDIYGELYRFIPVLAHGLGFNIDEIKVENLPRYTGKTKYGTSRFIKGILDLLTMIFLTRYGTRPLHVFGITGLIIGSIGFIYNAYRTITGLIEGRIGHYASIALGLFLMVFGLQLIFTGLLGELIVTSRGRALPHFKLFEPALDE